MNKNVFVPFKKKKIPTLIKNIPVEKFPKLLTCLPRDIGKAKTDKEVLDILEGYYNRARKQEKKMEYLDLINFIKESKK